MNGVPNLTDTFPELVGKAYADREGLVIGILLSPKGFITN